jgi:hypothetical protein
MQRLTVIPEDEWNAIQALQEKIARATFQLEEDTRNLNNLLHALHGEGVRGRQWTSDGKPQVFVGGKWVGR